MPERNFFYFMLLTCLINFVVLEPAHATLINSSVDLTGVMMMRSPNQSQLQKTVSRGVEALNKGDMKAAESAFSESLRLDPNQTGALIGLAEVDLRRKQPNKAEAELKKALTLQPDSAEIHAALGRFHFSQRQYLQAEAEYKKAISLDKGFFMAFVDLGDLYLAVQRKPKEAEESYHQAIALQPSYVPARFGLGMALNASGKKVEAIKELYEAARHAPNDPTPLHVIGRIYAQQKMFEQAAQALTDTLKVKPDFQPALYDRADVYAEMNKNLEAAKDYKQILHDNPGDSLVQMKLGMIYQRLDRPSDAELAYHAALKGNPNLAPAYNNLAMLALKRGGKVTDALSWARKAVELSPGVPQFHDTLGWVYRTLGEKVKAIEELEKATQLKPPQAEIYYRLAMVYQEAGKTQEALVAFKRALQIQADFPEANQAKVHIEALSR